ncbi:MAG TPA: macro domain-containing protein [Candidatus Elarobacter sp.]|jgi:O-acetyl-ADP-ribose deacetylase (regulator of RNase III)|nr:macro domain-containing protein [Candidatus Elarobacter sp.]
MISRASIVTVPVDAVVNAANEAFRGGGGVDGAIHRAAGPELLEECKRHARLPTGDAILTGGYRLPARWIVHTVGPIWHGDGTEAELLGRAYDSVFRVAREQPPIRTIAFPAISTGVYGYPKGPAASVAVAAMRRNEAAFDEIVVCLMDDENVAAYERALSS